MMSRDYFSIGYDSEFQFEKATKKSFQPETMIDDMAMPCETCEHVQKCESGFLECSAFRSWASTGKFVDSDVQRYVRAAK
jgi:hypothetical protein